MSLKPSGLERLKSIAAGADSREPVMMALRAMVDFHRNGTQMGAFESLDHDLNPSHDRGEVKTRNLPGSANFRTLGQGPLPLRSFRAASRARERSRIASCRSSGTQTAVSCLAKPAASRRFVFTRTSRLEAAILSRTRSPMTSRSN
jgi:hypothetical protein